MAPRIINFEGRRISVPADATDDEIVEILSAPAAPVAAATGGRQAATSPSQSGGPDFAKVKRNIRKMIDLGAPESDIDAYVAEEGLTAEALRAAPRLPAAAPIVTPEAAAAAEGRSLPNPAGYAAPPPRAERTAGRALQIGVQGVGRGLADVAGMLPDLANGAANLALAGADAVASPFGGSVDYRFPASALGSDAISSTFGRLAETAGLPLVEPATPQEKLSYNINRFGTQGLATGAGLARAGAAMTPSNTPRLSDPFVKPYAEAPLKTIAGDTAAGAGSGAGLTGSQELLPQSVRDAGGGSVGTIADLLAMTAGGVTGGVTTATIADAPSSARSFVTAKRPALGVEFDPQTGEAVTNRAFDKASAKMQARASNPTDAVQSIDNTVADFGNLPLPTTGLMSGDTGLINLEQAIRTKQGGSSLAEGANVDASVKARNSFVDRDIALRDAAVSEVNRLRPEGADPAALQRAAAAEAESLRATQAGQSEAALAERQARVSTVEGRAQNVDTIRQNDAAPLTPYQSADAGTNASRNLDNAVVDQTYLPDRARKNELYNAVDPNRTEMVDIAPMADAATRVRDQVNQLGPQGQQLPAEFVQRIERLAPNIEQQPSSVLGPDGQPVMRDVNTGGPGQAAVGDIVDLQKYTGKARETARQAGNFDLADNLGRLRAGANQTIEGSPAAAEANRNYREDFAPKYRPGPGDEMAKFTKDIDRDGTRSTTPPEKTASRFLAGPEKAAALRRVLDDSPAGPQGNAAVRDYLLSDLATSGVIDSRSGVIRPDRLRAWCNQYGSQLDTAPGFGAEVDGMIERAAKGERVSGGLTQQIKDAQTKLKDAERAAGRSEREVENLISKSALSSVIDADADRAVFSVMRDADTSAKKIGELARLTANNPDARDGLKAAVADYFATKVSGVAPQNVSEGTQNINFAQLTTEFQRHQKTLATVFSPEEMNQLQQAQRVLAPLAKRAQQAGIGSKTAENAGDYWRTFEASAKLYFGMLKGGGITRTARLLASSFDDGSTQAADRLVARAMFDPNLAKQLLSAQVEKVPAPATNREVGKILRKGELGRQMSGEDDEDRVGAPIPRPAAEAGNLFPRLRD